LRKPKKKVCERYIRFPCLVKAIAETMDIELGGNIRLSGFSEMEPATLIVVKKIVGNYTKRIAERSSSFKDITINLKKMHEKSHEISAKVNADKLYTAEVSEYNLFFALDKALSKIMSQLER